MRTARNKDRNAKTFQKKEEKEGQSNALFVEKGEWKAQKN